MKSEDIRLGDLPEDFLEEVMTEFTAYTIPLSRIRGADRSTFTPLGSGVLVRKGSRVGILTAHHCFHACKPEVKVGIDGIDSLILILNRGRKSVMLLPNEMHEHVLASPIEDECGPDLIFIELFGEKRSLVLAICSAWPMDDVYPAKVVPLTAPKTLISFIGFPEEQADTQIEANGILREVMHRSFINAIEPDGVFQRNGWDYIDSTCVYSSAPDLPATFGGVSGGPIWGMEVLRDAATGKFRITTSCLLGISFYQGPVIEGKRKIRGHFVKSIYENAWREIK